MNELTAKLEDLLNRVKNKSELRPFFFRKVKGLELFDRLYQEGFFSPEQNPTPIKKEDYVQIPFWPVTEYLVATSSQLDKPENEKYADKFLQIIRTCTNYARTENYGNFRTWRQFAKVVPNIPTKLITLDDIELIGYWLNDPYERGLVEEELGKNWLPRLMNANDTHCNELATRLLKKIYVFEIRDHKYGSFEEKRAILRLDNRRAQRLTSLIAKESGRKLGLSAVKIFYQLLIELLEGLGNDCWSYIWRPAIEDHKQNHGLNDTDDIFIQALRDSLLGFVETDLDRATQYIESLLDSKYETIKRIAIYVIGQKYDVMGYLADKILADKYFLSNFRHELWHFLKSNYPKLNQERKEAVITIINNLKAKNDKGNLDEKASAYKRATWLFSIKEFDSSIDKQYKEYVQIAGVKPEHPDFSSYGSVSSVDHKSPFPLDELRTLEIDALVAKLNSFEDSGQFGEPSLRELAKCFKDLVKEDPSRFYKHFGKFKDGDLAFTYEIIEAYRDLWNEKKQITLFDDIIPWNDVWFALLDFCMQLAQSEHFWSEENSKERIVGNRRWVVGAIGHLIEDGTKSDEHAFDHTLIEVAKQVLGLFLKKQKGDEFKIDSDAVSVAIISPRGQCIKGLINLALRSCRLADKSKNRHEEAWLEFEAIFDTELELSNKEIFEFATLVANYLPNFFYMSRDWVEKKLDNIFNQQNYQQWLCAIQGYAYLSQIYEEIYKHLKNNGDLIRALDDQNIKEKVEESIIQNIVIAYINDYEYLSDRDSLISILLDRNIYKEVSQAVWFIGSLSKDDDQKLKNKVFELWPKLRSLINLETREGKGLASQLCLWSVFVEKIDDSNRDLLLAIAPYADEDHNSYKFLKYLAKLSDGQPFEVYEIWIKMLEGCTPDYPEKATEQFLCNLVGKGREGIRKAKKVVDTYLKRGDDGPERYLRKIMKTT